MFKNIIDELNARGLIKDYSNETQIRELLSTPQTIYCGFDPSANSLHIGNFIMIATLMRFVQYGHRVIALVGGGTGMIGDPSGKSKERAFLTAEKVQENVNSIKNQLSKFLDFKDSSKAILLNNYDWLKDISLLEYLRDYGKFININYMLSKDVVASRLANGISYTEFSYMLLQSIDFLKLHEKYGVSIQIGGSDQWGNLTSGLELIRKIKGDEEKVGCMVLHLITRSDGKKFGKSEEGALYLDEKLTSPYKLYQFFLNSTDEDAVHYLKVFTFVPVEEINEIEKEHLANLGQRIAQKRLAYEVTKIIHGEEKANEAVKMSEAFFKNEFESLTKENILELFNNSIHKIDVSNNFMDILIEVGVCKSKREARELISGNSISLNGNKISDIDYKLSDVKLLHDQFIVLKKGKKNFYLLSTK